MKHLRKSASLAVGIGAVALLVFLTGNTHIAADGIKNGLHLIEDILLPSLFPLLVLSDLLLRTGAFNPLRLLAAPLGKRLGVSPAGGTALLLGWLLGSPVGTCLAAADLENGHLTTGEYHRIVCLTANTGIGFPLGVVGIGIFGSPLLGMLLYSAMALAAFLLAFLWHLIDKTAHQNQKTPPNGMRKRDFATAFTTSVKGCMNTFLNLSAFVLIFSALAAYLRAIASHFHLPLPLTVSLCGVLELTTGVMQASTLPEAKEAYVWIAFFTGFAGLSIGLQALAVAGKNAPPFPLLLGVKCLQGILTTAIVVAVLALWQPTISFAKPCLQTLADLRGHTTPWGIWFFILLALFLFFYRAIQKPLVYFYKK